MGKDVVGKAAIQRKAEASESEGPPARRELSLILPTNPEPCVELTKNKPISIDEEAYTTAVSKIILRDFYPDLPSLRIQTKALDSIINGTLDPNYYASFIDAEFEEDYNIPIDGSEQYTPRGQTNTTICKSPGSSDVGVSSSGDTNRSPCVSLKPPNRRYINVSKMSLAMFQAKYTSEDNASFSELMERERQKVREGFKRIYDREKYNLRLADTSSSERKLLEQPNTVDAWRSKVNNSLMYCPDGYPLTKYDEVQTNAPPKKIVLEATGFKHPFPIRWSKVEDNASSGGTLPGTDTESTCSAILGGNLKSIKDTKRHKGLRGYSYVPSTPELIPGIDLDPGELMTWGKIESTPVALDDDTNLRRKGPCYELLPTPRCDLVGHKLSEKFQMQHKRTHRLKPHRSSILDSPLIHPGSASSLSSSSYNTASRTPYADLSPAAQSLLHKMKNKSRRPISNSGMFLKGFDKLKK